MGSLYRHGQFLVISDADGTRHAIKIVAIQGFREDVETGRTLLFSPVGMAQLENDFEDVLTAVAGPL